jgi:TonB family protein
MQSPGTKQPRSRPALIFSIAVHLALFALLLVANARAKVHLVQQASQRTFPGIEVAGGSHATRLFLPKALITVEARKPAKDPPPIRKVVAPTHPPLPTPPQKSAGGSAADAHQNSQGVGDAAKGVGSDAENADPAFPIFSPRPPVTDRALLPGSQREIVVDVNLNAAGDVVGASLVKGMGNNLDQIVLDTVKTWRFHPATVNGTAVASQAELIFPFNPSYPITPA